MPESVQSCFELSIHFPVFFPASSWHSYIPSNFFFLTSPFSSAKSVQFMNFSEAMFYENYLTSDFHTNTVISSMFAYSSKWRRENCDKAYWQDAVTQLHRTPWLFYKLSF